MKLLKTKTFWAGLISSIGAAATYFTGDAALQDVLTPFILGIFAMTGRAAIGKIEKPKP